MNDIKAQSLALLDMCFKMLEDMSEEEIQARLKETGLDKYCEPEPHECPPHEYEKASTTRRVVKDGLTVDEYRLDYEIVLTCRKCKHCGFIETRFSLRPLGQYCSKFGGLIQRIT